MAILKDDYNFWSSKDLMKTYDTPIQGQMLKIVYKLSELQSLEFDSNDSYREHVKHEIALKLAKSIIENKLGEFTFVTDPASHTKTIYGRCYITPNDQTRILRTVGEPK